MNISIFAAVGSQNLGDELILKNEIELLKQEFGYPLSPSGISLCEGDKNISPSSRGIPAKQKEELYFKVASYDPQNPVFDIKNTKYFEYFPIAVKNPKNILRNIKNFFVFLRVVIWSDIVLIGGGGIIYDSEVQSVGDPLKQWLFRARVARIFRKKIYFYALGIDIKKKENFKILRNIFQNAYKITVRDEKSKKLLEQVGLSPSKYPIELVDDPVMHENNGNGEIIKTLSSRNFSLKDFESIDFEGKEVGLALRSGYIGKSGNTQIEKLLIAELCEYIEKKGGKIVFLPHSFHTSDKKVNDFVFLQDFVREGRQIKMSLREVYDWYREDKRPVSSETGLRDNKLLISMRLHSIILASVYGIPQVVLSYSQKTEEFLRKMR